MSWTDERVERLKKLWMEGLSASQIAGELGEGVTRNAVIGKVHRLKLSARAKPASGAPRPRSAGGSRPVRRPGGGSVGSAVAKRRMPGPGPVVGATALKVSEDVETEAYVAASPAAELYIPPEERIGLLDLSEHTCKWPIGDPLTPDFYFCGRESDEGKPYCTFHARRAYHQIEKRKR